MTACPIRYQRQVPDRKGKIFYTSITSLSHISKVAGHEAAHGWRRRCAGRYHPHSSSERSVRLRTVGRFILPVHMQSLSSPLWIAAFIIIGSKLQTNVHPSRKGGALMQFLTHIIFLLNVLKNIINHFS